MKLKTIVAATVLALAPAIGFAMCSDREHQAQSCATGTTWDADKQACVPQASS